MGFLKSLFGGKKQPTPEELEQQKEKNFDILKFDGMKASRMGQLSYAIKCYSEALALKEDYNTRLYLAQTYMALQENPLALAQLQKLIEMDKENIESYVMVAQVAENMKDWQAMNEACEKALLIDETRADIYYYCGEAYHGLEDDISAIAMLTKSITLDKNQKNAYMLRCQILKEMAQFAEAEKDADKLIELDPENEIYILNKAEILSVSNTEAALVYCQKAIEQNGFLDEAYLLANHIYVSQQQYDKALSLLNDAIEINPNFAKAYMERGNVKMLLGKNDEAAEDLKKGLELEPKEGEAINGNFTNIEQEMNAQYRANNPFG